MSVYTSITDNLATVYTSKQLFRIVLCALDIALQLILGDDKHSNRTNSPSHVFKLLHEVNIVCNEIFKGLRVQERQNFGTKMLFHILTITNVTVSNEGIEKLLNSWRLLSNMLNQQSTFLPNQFTDLCERFILRSICWLGECIGYKVLRSIGMSLPEMSFHPTIIGKISGNGCLVGIRSSYSCFVLQELILTSLEVKVELGLLQSQLFSSNKGCYTVFVNLFKLA